MFFKEFLQTLNQQQVDAIYQKSFISVELVRMYNSNLLANIATIADLPSGAYGLYYSGDNRKVLSPETEKALIGWGKVGRHNLDMLPKKLISQYYPNIPQQAIKSADTIRVNVKRIMAEFPDDLNRIIQIASTIVHEATHEIERETIGTTSENSAYAAETKFMNWLKSNWKMVSQRFPDLQGTPDLTITMKH